MASTPPQTQLFTMVTTPIPSFPNVGDAHSHAEPSHGHLISLLWTLPQFSFKLEGVTSYTGLSRERVLLVRKEEDSTGICHSVLL